MSPARSPALRVGQRIRLTLGALATGGEAVARHDALVVFVEGGAPGDEADVEITEVRRSFARGVITSLHTPSMHRVSPRCAIYGECGGCQLQHLSPSAQRDAKTRIVADAMRTIAGLPESAVAPCMPTTPWGYRNKMQLVAARNGRLGLYRRHTHEVVSMETCHIAHPMANRILEAVSALLDDLQWPAYDEATGEGLLRHVLARVAGPAEKPRAFVVPIVTREHVPRLDAFCARLRERVPEVAGIALNINDARTNVILGRRTVHVWGAEHLEEVVSGIRFKVAPASFFQVNREGLSHLVELVGECLQPSPAQIVIDGYCGVGALSLPLASRVGRVIGIEEVPPAVENARQNARLNQIDNAVFEQGAVEAVLPTLPAADAVILDPPRKGCAPAVIETIAAHAVPTVVYVSCNPATLARDLVRFREHGYHPKRIQPVDMFPQTAHVECVTHLTRS
ncbi:MAG: 23S rRNA (uracil(1939)-C(5))-methyltransferase RlmD [Proteobacteria bacterium]|nr:23S rRNA (uracil(1939)-C(5))-methyltransferase RlmD [Pseudomonadota bacterium]